jgi:hypothetical protein
MLGALGPPCLSPEEQRELPPKRAGSVKLRPEPCTQPETAGRLGQFVVSIGAQTASLYLEHAPILCGDPGLLLLAPVPLWANRCNDPRAGNPLVPGYFADPCLRKFEDTYYLYATPDGWGTGEGPFVIWSSKDFVHWTTTKSP